MPNATSTTSVSRSTSHPIRRTAKAVDLPLMAPERFPRTWLLILLLATVAIAPFAVAVAGPWIYDDTFFIANNPYVHGLEHWQHWLTAEFANVSSLGKRSDLGGFWRPLVTASYALDWAVGGGSTVPFHATNLLLHAAVTILSFFALRRWLKAPFPALLATVLFALCPFRTESVSWITGRPDPLMMVGILLALEGIGWRLRGRRLGFALEAIGVLIAYGSKETAVVLPAIAAIEVWAASDGRSWARLLRLAPGVVGVHSVIALVYLAFHQRFFPVALAVDWPVITRLEVVLESLGRYGAMVLWPTNLTFGSGLIYLDDGLPRLDVFWEISGAIIILATGALAALTAKRQPSVALALAVLTITMVPASNILTVGYAAVFGSPRFLYLPALPLAFLFGIGWIHVSRNRSVLLRRASQVVVGLVAVCLIGLTVSRSLVYQDADAFWRAEIERNPDYYPAVEYFTSQALVKDRPRQAIRLAHLAFTGIDKTFAKRLAPTLIPLALLAVLRLTPDLDQTTLNRVYEFTKHARAGRNARLELPRYQMTVVLPAGDPGAAVFRDRITGRNAYVEAGSRVGEWSAVKAEAESVVMDDASSGLTFARLAAASHDFAFAKGALERYVQENPRDKTSDAVRQAIDVLHASQESPSKVPLPMVATAYVRLMAWGRAYEVLLPLLRSANPPPEATDLLAKIAFCAGDGETARRILASGLSGDGVERMLGKWALEMQWEDAPLGANELPLPDALLARLPEAELR